MFVEDLAPRFALASDLAAYAAAKLKESAQLLNYSQTLVADPFAYEDFESFYVQRFRIFHDSDTAHDVTERRLAVIDELLQAKLEEVSQ